MHRAGLLSLIAGALMTALGLGAGFGMMFGGHDDGAKFFLALVPIGFLLGFTGAVTAIVTSPRSTGTPER